MLAQAEAVAANFADLKLSIAVERAEIALAKGRPRDAAAACRRALDASPSTTERAWITALFGLSQVRSGQRADGLRNCESAAAMTEKSGVFRLRRDAVLALAEARAENGDSAGALGAVRQLLPSLEKRPLSRWRALALAARARGPAARDDARAALDQLDILSREWGQPAVQRYLSRPDVQPLWRTVSRLANPPSR
jgi:hypothetical protein